MTVYEEFYFYFDEKCKLLENKIRLVDEKISEIDRQLSRLNQRKEQYHNIDGSGTRSVLSPLKTQKKETKAPYHDQLQEWAEKKEELEKLKQNYQTKLDYYRDKYEKVRTLETGTAGEDTAAAALGAWIDGTLLPRVEKLRNRLDFTKQLTDVDIVRARMELNQMIADVGELEQRLKEWHETRRGLN